MDIAGLIDQHLFSHMPNTLPFQVTQTAIAVGLLAGGIKIATGNLKKLSKFSKDIDENEKQKMLSSLKENIENFYQGTCGKILDKIGLTKDFVSGFGKGVATSTAIQSSTAADGGIAVPLVAAKTLNQEQGTGFVTGSSWGTALTTAFAFLRSLSTIRSALSNFIVLHPVVLGLKQQISKAKVAIGIEQEELLQGDFDLQTQIDMTEAQINKVDKLKQRKRATHIAGALGGLGAFLTGLSLARVAFNTPETAAVIQDAFNTDPQTTLEMITASFRALGIGIAGTAVMFSSSAFLGTLFSAADVIDPLMLFHATIGANIATCLTTTIAAKATRNKNAMVVADMNILFNVLGASIAMPLLIIPETAEIITNFLQTVAPESKSTQGAYFHIGFNAITTIAYIPLVKHLLKALNSIYDRKGDQKKATPSRKKNLQPLDDLRNSLEETLATLQAQAQNQTDDPEQESHHDTLHELSPEVFISKDILPEQEVANEQVL